MRHNDHVIYPTVAARTFTGGIPNVYAFVSLVVSLVVAFIFGNLFYSIPVLLILWIVGLVLTRNDPDFMSVLIAKRLKIQKTKNIGEFKGNQYLP